MSLEIQENISLAQFTTLQIGGDAKYFCVVSNESELVEAVHFAKEKSLRIYVIGGGSNVLISDEGLNGFVIKNEITGYSDVEDGNTIQFTVGAGEIFDEIIAYTVTNDWWGLENLSYIPGSVGATPIQNVGAYGVEVSDIISEVRVYDIENETFIILNNKECTFGYRDSVFKHDTGSQYVVVSVMYALSVDPKPLLLYKDLVKIFPEGSKNQQEIRETIIKIRSNKFPDWNIVGTAGSFFKNPVVTRGKFEELSSQYPELPGFHISDDLVKIPLGYILDKILGLRGIKEGSVGTYEGQALVLINEGGATYSEIKTFAESIVEKVRVETGIKIDWEVTYLK